MSGFCSNLIISLSGLWSNLRHRHLRHLLTHRHAFAAVAATAVVAGAVVAAAVVYDLRAAEALRCLVASFCTSTYIPSFPTIQHLIQTLLEA